MSKKFVFGLIMVVCACALVAFAGCSSQGSSDSPASQPKETSRSAESLSLDPNTNTGTVKSSPRPSNDSEAASNASAASNAAAEPEPAETADYVSSVPEGDPYGTGIHHATVTVNGYSPFTITLDANNAPVSVYNFCQLANKGYYDGLSFYRFQEDFCMQGGTKGNTASGNDDTISKIVGEFSDNGVSNALANDFKKGVVAMARSSEMNSASSTFFVTMGSGSSVSSSLNGKYAAFGTIDDAGMEVVDKIFADHVEAGRSDSMGAISDESKQAVIQSITITD